MIILVWWILSLCGVCEFTWLPVFIEATLACVICMFDIPNDNNNTILGFSATMGIAYFAFLKFFFGLSISGWWVLLSPLAFPIVLLVPGGFSLINLLFQHLGWMQLPTWGLITGIIIDVLLFAFFLFCYISERKDR